MCGIAGIHRRTDKPIPKINKLADELMLAIENRGRHAAGYLAMQDDGKVQMQKLAIPATQFVKERGRIRANSRNVLLHTRWATVGRKEDPRNAHPVAAGTIACIHNGTIYNASELFREYKLPRLAEVDSEIFPALINHLGWDKVEKALAKMDGGAAVAIVNTEVPDEVILARLSGYPLVYAVTKDMVIWASTETAIKMAWHRTYGKSLRAKVITMEEGRMARANGKVEETALAVRPRYLPASKLPKTAGRKRASAASTARGYSRSSGNTPLPKKRSRKATPLPTTPLFADGPRAVNYGLGYAIQQLDYEAGRLQETLDRGYHDEARLGGADAFYDALIEDGVEWERADAYAYGTGPLPEWVSVAYAEFLA